MQGQTQAHAIVVRGWRHDEINSFYDAAVISDLPLYRYDGRIPSQEPANDLVNCRNKYNARIDHYRIKCREKKRYYAAKKLIASYEKNGIPEENGHIAHHKKYGMEALPNRKVDPQEYLRRLIAVHVMKYMERVKKARTTIREWEANHPPKEKEH